MKKIVIFGDSFAKDTSNQATNWIEYVSENLKLPLINYGHCGSSLGYSFDQFMKYYNSDEYDKDDLIVFIIAFIPRVHIVGSPFPDLSGYFSPTEKDIARLTKEQQKWIIDHKELMRWSLNVSNDSINFEEVKVSSYLKLWAGWHPTNNLVLLPAFKVMHQSLLRKIALPTSNFFPLITEPLFLASMNEFKSLPAVYDEPAGRTNHLSQCNMEILSRMITDVFTHRDASRYDFSRFKKALF